MAEWAALAAITTAFAAVLLLSGATTRLDNVVYDFVLRHLQRSTTPQVVIVAIDDQSLASVGPWPWPRSVHASLLDRLTAANVKAVGYDVLFIEPSREPSEDLALARALAASGRVCLPLVIQAPGPLGAPFMIVRPSQPLAQAAAGLGHVNLDFDADGLSRRAHLVERWNDVTIPHLMRCTQMVGALGRAPKFTLPRPQPGAVLARDESVLIPYGGGPGRVRSVSAASVLRGEVPEAYLTGRHVIVGSTAAGLHDRHSTPVTTRNETMTGAEVQANLLEALLGGRTIAQAPLPLQLAITLAAVWILLAALLIAPPGWTPLIGFSLAGAVLALCSGGLSIAGVWAPPSPAVLTVLLILPLWGWRRLEAASTYMTGELERLHSSARPATGAHALIAGDAIERQIQLMGRAVEGFRRLHADAVAAARQREDVVQLLSHDIRSPQVSILALIEGHGGDGAATKATKAAIAGHARRTLDLADNFVHIAKVDSGVRHMELLDLASLVVEARNDLWPVARRKGVSFAMVGTDQEWLVEGDRSLLSRAVINLLDNAIKYGPPDGVVTAELALAASSASAEAVQLTVTDQGPGLTESQIARLFQRFERTGVAASGLGLGLLLVQQVAGQHQGAIECVSRLESGAQFVLTLPLATDQEATWLEE